MSRWGKGQEAGGVGGRKQRGKQGGYSIVIKLYFL